MFLFETNFQVLYRFIHSISYLNHPKLTCGTLLLIYFPLKLQTVEYF